MTEIKAETGTKEPNQSSNLVSTKDFKKGIRARFPKDSTLRIVVEAEKDFITGEEFLAKMPIWMILVSLEN